MQAFPAFPPRFIVGIFPDGEEEAQCIRVAHPSGLYVTDDYIVTHNSSSAGQDAVSRAMENAKMPRQASTFSEAREAAKAFMGKPLTNLDNGMVATVSRNALDKMLSKSAVSKSTSAADHSLAVANLDALFENAVYGWAKEDRESDTNIKAVHRLFAPMNTAQGTQIVKLTVKELGEKADGNRIYTVESMEIESPASIWVAANLKHDGLESISTPYAGHVESLVQAVQERNQNDRSDSAPFFSISGNPSSPFAVTLPRRHKSNTLFEEIKNIWGVALDEIIYQFQDKHIDLKRVIDAIKETGGTVRDAFDAYISETLMHGRIANSIQRFSENEINPILEDMRKHGISMEDAERYLHARHAKERNDKMAKLHPTQAEIDARIAQIEADIKALKGTKADTSKLEAERNALKNAKPWTGTLEERNMLSGMSNKDAQDILDAAHNGPKSTIYISIGLRIDDINARTRADMLAYGLETQDTISGLEKAYQHYVPLYRDMEESDLLAQGNGTGSGLAQRGSRIRSATGSLRDVENIFAHIVAQREQTIVRGEKKRRKCTARAS